MPQIYTVFDTETTGLYPGGGDRIVEIAAIQIIDGEISNEEFVTLINPERAIPFAASRVNNISDAMVRNAPIMKEILPLFMEFIEGTTLVAHNANFDMRFLKSECEICGIHTPLPESICTVQLSRKIFPHERYHNLDDVSFRLDIEIEDRHRALGDVQATAQAFLKLNELDVEKEIQPVS